MNIQCRNCEYGNICTNCMYNDEQKKRDWEQEQIQDEMIDQKREFIKSLQKEKNKIKQEDE